MAASIKKTTLTITTDTPRGFEVDIIRILEVICPSNAKIGDTSF
jgi:hypothetical protein